MVPLRHILLAVLVFGVSTIWIPGRWAATALECGSYACAAAVAAQVVIGNRRLKPGAPAVILAGMSVWAGAQWALHLTVVRSDTAATAGYWLAAACLTWAGRTACADREPRRDFLRSALWAGTVVALAGIVQQVTSNGRVFWLFDSGYDSDVIGPFLSRNNYASFIEMLVPLALVFAFQAKENARTYLAIAAALVAAAIASGSRAGAVIVLIEAAVGVVLLSRLAKGAAYRLTATFALLAIAFTVILGYQFLWQRLSGDRDPYAGRREFVESAIAMVKAEPLHGFGLGTWQSAYRPFARIDTGRVVNHAHNEWLQWAAEGGLPACGLMAVVFGLCLRPAWFSVWGLGVVAVFAHAVVDYPFMRLGLAAWIFVLIGGLSAYRDERRARTRAGGVKSERPGRPARILAAAVLPILAFAAFQSLRLGWADLLYRRATPESLQRAAELCPETAEYQQALAEAAPGQAPERLRKALALNPFLTSARIALASRQETDGDLAGAEATLLEAVRYDRQYAPAWALTNFYFRTGQASRFWDWAQAAAAISYGELSPLFDVCFLVTNDAGVVLSRAVPHRREAERKYLRYLMVRGRVEDARAAAMRIASAPVDEDREILLKYTDLALAKGSSSAARQVWNALSSHALISYPSVAPGVLVNADLSRPLFGRGFDWRPDEGKCAVVARTKLPEPAIEILFSGRQPEECEALDHVLEVTPNRRYVLRFQFTTRDLPSRTGLRWTIGNGRDFDFPEAASWTDGVWQIESRQGFSRLALAYRRSTGTSRIEGALLVRRIRLEVVDETATLQFSRRAADKP